jgi:hypothetical protein
MIEMFPAVFKRSTGLFSYFASGIMILMVVNIVLSTNSSRDASSRFASSEDGVLLLFKCSLEH